MQTPFKVYLSWKDTGPIFVLGQNALLYQRFGRKADGHLLVENVGPAPSPVRDKAHRVETNAPGLVLPVMLCS